MLGVTHKLVICEWFFHLAIKQFLMFPHFFIQSNKMKESKYIHSGDYDKPAIIQWDRRPSENIKNRFHQNRIRFLSFFSVLIFCVCSIAIENCSTVYTYTHIDRIRLVDVQLQISMEKLDLFLLLALHFRFRPNINMTPFFNSLFFFYAWENQFVEMWLKFVAIIFFSYRNFEKRWKFFTQKLEININITLVP